MSTIAIGYPQNEDRSMRRGLSN